MNNTLQSGVGNDETSGNPLIEPNIVSSTPQIPEMNRAVSDPLPAANNSRNAMMSDSDKYFSNTQLPTVPLPPHNTSPTMGIPRNVFPSSAPTLTLPPSADSPYQRRNQSPALRQQESLIDLSSLAQRQSASPITSHSSDSLSQPIPVPLRGRPSPAPLPPRRSPGIGPISRETSPINSDPGGISMTTPNTSNSNSPHFGNTPNRLPSPRMIPPYGQTGYIQPRTTPDIPSFSRASTAPLPPAHSFNPSTGLPFPVPTAPPTRPRGESPILPRSVSPGGNLSSGSTSPRSQQQIRQQSAYLSGSHFYQNGDPSSQNRLATPTQLSPHITPPMSQTGYTEAVVGTLENSDRGTYSHL